MTATATTTWAHDTIGRWTLTTDHFTARIVRDRSQTTAAPLFPWTVWRIDGARVGSGVSCSLRYAQADAERAIAGRELREC